MHPALYYLLFKATITMPDCAVPSPPINSPINHILRLFIFILLATCHLSKTNTLYSVAKPLLLPQASKYISVLWVL